MKAVDDDRYRYVVLETRDCETIFGEAFQQDGDAYPHSDSSTKTWVRIHVDDVPTYTSPLTIIYDYREFVQDSVQSLFVVDVDYYLDNDLPVPGEPTI